MKVANLVRACFPYVFAHGLITQEEIDEFLKPGSGSVFGMGNKFPVLKVDDGSGDLSFTTDTEKEYSAFYKPDTCSLSFGGKNYLLSCQFRNKGVDDVMSWLKQKGMTEDVIQKEIAKQAEDNLEVEGMDDKLTVALKVFQKGRVTKTGLEGWKTFDDWAKKAEHVAGQAVDVNLAENPETYAEFMKNFAIMPMTARLFSRHTLEERQAVLEYLQEQQQHPHTVEWYLDEKNLPTSASGVHCDGFGPKVVLYAMLRLHPTKFVAWSKMIYSSLVLVGLHKGSQPKELTVETYADCKAKCDKVLARMHEMGIGKLADDDSDADYITVNEFIWFVNTYQKEIGLKPGAGVLMNEKKATDGVLVTPCVTFAKDTPLQQIIYGAPGTGKSFKVNETTEMMLAEDVVRTTFHPDSDYATFVGAYKPGMEVDDYETVVTTGEKTAGGTVTKKDGLVRQRRIAYEFVPQAFMQAYVRAWRNIGAAKASDGEDAAPVVLVIEEINRGNCAQIFGDLFQLLDRNDDGWSSYAINADVDLARWLKDEFAGAHQADDEDHGEIVIPSEVDAALPKGVALKDVVSGRKLLLPPNLYIWATMNTSDQSLFPIDSAFKRRWDWKYVPISDAGKGWKIEVDGLCYSWWDFLVEANKLVQEVTESEDKKLGYFFVKAKGDVVTLEQFVGKVVFYLWNDVFKNGDLPSVLAESGDGGFAFGKFFKNDGKPNGAVVKAFLEKLGVKEVAAGGGAPALPDDGASA